MEYAVRFYSFTQKNVFIECTVFNWYQTPNKKKIFLIWQCTTIKKEVIIRIVWRKFVKTTWIICYLLNMCLTEKYNHQNWVDASTKYNACQTFGKWFEFCRNLFVVGAFQALYTTLRTTIYAQTFGIQLNWTEMFSIAVFVQINRK